MFKRFTTFHGTMLLVALAMLALYQFGLVSAAEAGLISAAGLGGMILDERLEFADAVSVAAGTGTTVIGDVIDLKPSTVNPNTTVDLEGSDMYLVIQTDTEIITGGSAGEIQFFLVTDAAADLASGVLANCTQHCASALLVTDDAAANSAALNAGGIIYAGKLPRGSYERYMGILCTIGTTTVTAGKINAFLTSDPALWRAYGDNVA